MKKLTTRFLLFFLLYSFTVQAQLTTSTAITDSLMVTNILLGSGVYARNIQYHGATGARGTFSCAGACNLGISSGIMLTSGSVGNAIGPNNSGSLGTATGTAGDPTLDALGATTLDASVLEFDFDVATDSVEFRFVFGSEEYSDYVNSNCNDIFGFFINGPGFNNTNIALIPGTSIPVTINNVNNGYSLPGVVPSGPCMNCAYWNDNTGGISLQYDGYTAVLTAAARVRPCEIYHIKLAIADQCDEAFDSGVFLEGNSFTAIGVIPIYVNGTIAAAPRDTVYICPGDSVLLSMPESHNYNWSTGDTIQSIWVDTIGTYVAYATGLGCFSFTSQVSIQWAPNIALITPLSATNFCVGDSVILSANNGNSYLWSTGATTQNITVLTAGLYTVTVNNGGNCIAVSPPVQVTVIGISANITSSGSTTFCDGGNVNLISDPAPNYLWSTGATTQSINVTVGGNYTVTVSSTGCNATMTVPVIVNLNPVPILTGNPASCTGVDDTLYVTTGYNSYVWSTGQLATTSIIVNTSGNYSVTVTDINGCTGNTSVNLNFLPFAIPVISAPAGFCSGSQALLDAGAGYSNYVWSTGASGQLLNVLSGGNYTVTVTAANGCTGYNSINIAMYSLPNPAINGLAAFCQNDSTQLTAASPGLNYLWSTGSANSSIWVLQTGSYTLTVTDANNCSAQSVHAINVNALPIVQITGDFEVCQGDAGVMDATAGFNNYLWSTGDLTAQINPLVSGNYTVTVTDINGCKDTAIQNLVVNNLPIPSINGLFTFCQGNSTSLQSSSAFPTYLWSDGSNSNSITVSTSGPYTLTVTDANTCSASVTVQVNMNLLPQPVLPFNTSVCIGDSIQIQPGSFTSYLWADGSIQPTLWISSAGSYAVTVTDINGCSNSTSGTAIVNQLPTPVITGPAAICNGENGILDAGSGYQNYQWSNGSTGSTNSVQYDGTYTVTVTDMNGCKENTEFYLKVNPLPLVSITGNHDLCDGESTTLITTAGQGTYLWSDGTASESTTVNTTGNYRVTVTSPEGCTNTDAYQVNVHLIPVVDFTSQTNISCEEISLRFNNQSQYDPGSVFLWNFGDGMSSNEDQPSHIYATTGNFIVSLLITSPYGCSAQDTATITTTTPLPPTASFTSSARVVSVFNSEISFTNTSQNATRYKWSFDDNTSSEEVNPVHRFVNVGEVIVALKAWNGVDCYDETEITIEVVPLFVPNGFTPNGDGKNDVFFDGTPVIESTSYTMSIFDRWGKQIYMTNTQLQPWDGMVEGKLATEGVYSYLINIITLDGKPYEYRGTFSLVR